ncbi:hypothetical protein QDY71_05835 [Kingella negevensis]|uniref:Uncharacterized protein n=1 Tax=Kingella negevensis TaxID=1522312 RepID=A0A238HGW5_9NEIS|nr:hypothetical protein [Kingella negevensis]MDK4681197.1 hypothetical protein [Kingella negevensis]MDK4683394.1 hypothetical protein [Kingella negevensis]MDK4685062.1 hypothetical protein [Kingella negevensis]MDK4691471.1 hypothetical protein [Kingella negevensis]MDK4693379.1 hypothetical protein [Kingella negevensis]
MKYQRAIQSINLIDIVSFSLSFIVLILGLPFVLSIEENLFQDSLLVFVPIFITLGIQKTQKRHYLRKQGYTQPQITRFRTIIQRANEKKAWTSLSIFLIIIVIVTAIASTLRIMQPENPISQLLRHSSIYRYYCTAIMPMFIGNAVGNYLFFKKRFSKK